ncbi:MAG: gamma-glutamylcyclotransferase [Crocinitomicaceae bacterium]|nr:gamma-glutamylcyclotransferase [Crocinitomicaceae bacterium]
MYYFAYGSNMFTYRLEKRVGRVQIIGIGLLPKYSLIFNKISKDGSLKANISLNDNHNVYGVIFKINPSKKEELGKAEGLGKGYIEKKIEVEHIQSKEKIKVFTYIADSIDDSNRNMPYDWYVELIKIGAEEHNLPINYVDKIKSIPSKKDENVLRNNTAEYLVKESKAIKKYLSESFEYLFKLTTPKEFEISIKDHALHNRKILIEKAEKGFAFQTDSVIPKGIQRHKELQVSGKKLQLKEGGEDTKLFIDGKHFLLNNIEYDFDNTLKLLSGAINSIGNATIEEFSNKYLRLIIPIAKKMRIINDYQCRGFVVDYKLRTGLLILEINKKPFHLFELKYGEKDYLVIDCVEKYSLAEFQNCCQTILLTYAFLSGDYHSDEGYYLGFDDASLEIPKHILFHTFSDSHYNLNAAFTTNAYFGLDLENIKRDEKGFIDEETRKEQFKDIMFFPSSVFSNICQIAIENEKIFRSLLLLIFNQASTLEIKIPIQYVAIEALTGAIIKKGNSELKPISETELANKLIDELKNVTEKFLNENKIQIEDNDLISPLFKRLNSLNAPTNTDKLSKPFAEVGYTISDEEKKIIKLRDTFLHGSIKSFGNLDDDFKGLFYISLKLHFLICILLLKNAGFEGRIINYPKLYEYITEKYLEEEVLRKI